MTRTTILVVGIEYADRRTPVWLVTPEAAADPAVLALLLDSLASRQPSRFYRKVEAEGGVWTVWREAW